MDGRLQRQPARRGRPARPGVQTSKVQKSSFPFPIGGISPRKSSLRGYTNKRDDEPSLPSRESSVLPNKSSFEAGVTVKKARTAHKDAPNPPAVDQQIAPHVRYIQESPEVSIDDNHQSALDDDCVCRDVHHLEFEAEHEAYLRHLARLDSADRLARARKIFLRDRTARPIITLGRPTWSSSNMREILYNGTLMNETSRIDSPRTRTRFLDWQSEMDARDHYCWHGVDTYDLNPRTRQAREELVTGVPRRIMPYHEGLRLLERRPTLDILTAEERERLVEWWEEYYGQRVITPVQRRFPWIRFGERHYLQRKARQAEKDRNQKLYDMGLLSPGTAATLREHGKLHSDYQERTRSGSVALQRAPSRESGLTIRTW